MNEKETFICLVRHWIGYRSEALDTDINWDELKALSSRQGLIGIVLDSIEQLPDNKPPKDILFQWIGLVTQEERRYTIQRKASDELSLLLYEMGILLYVLKGDVVSECYPIPKHRCSSDLDCYLKLPTNNDDVWEVGNRIVESAGFKVRRDFYKNSTWILPGLTVENHKWLTPFRGNKRLTELERLLQSMLKIDDGNDVIEHTKLCRPPVMVSALFLIEHAYSHFLHEGLVWRHVLDWMMFSKKHMSEIDWKQLNEWIDEFGFRSFYDSYYSLGQYLLGEKVESDLTEKDYKMLNDIWAELDVHETVRGIRGKLTLVCNTWRARWKYKEFTDITWIQALWIQVKGFLFIKEPQLN